MAGVGTQKVFENDRVIVWHLDLSSRGSKASGIRTA